VLINSSYTSHLFV